jgi:hypothetical protein
VFWNLNQLESRMFTKQISFIKRNAIKLFGLMQVVLPIFWGAS